MSRDTPITPYTRPPIATDLAIKKTDYEIAAIYGNLPFSTIFRHIPLNSTKSTKFCQVLLDYNLKPILPRIRIN